MKPVHPIANFIQFTNNFSTEQLKAALATTSAPEHLLDKFQSYCIAPFSGTKAVLKLFNNMSPSNQEAFSNWVQENYPKNKLQTYIEEEYLRDIGNYLHLANQKKEFIVSRQFIEAFQSRLPNDEDIPEEYQGRDMEDYVSWGYALFGDIDYGAEREFNLLKLGAWMEFYEALDKNDPFELFTAFNELIDNS